MREAQVLGTCSTFCKQHSKLKVHGCPRMPLNEKLSWTFGGIAAASGGAVFLCDQMATTQNKTMQQALGGVLAFWCARRCRSRLHAGPETGARLTILA